MRLSSFSYPAFCAGATLALAACSGGAAPSMPAGAAVQSLASRTVSGATAHVGPSLAERFGSATRPAAGPGFSSAAVDAAGGAAIYLTDDTANTITVFSKTFTATAQLTGLPNPAGIARDPLGDVFVANIGGADVVEYARGLKSVKATLADPGQDPIDVAVDATTGTVGVANVTKQGVSGPGSVTFYAKGATTPCATVGDPNWAEVFFAAFDARGRLYIDGVATSGGTLVGVVSGGCAATKIATLGGTHLAFPGSIGVLKDGSILLDDQGSGHGSTVYEYAPPVNGTFGKARATVALTSSLDAVSVSLDETGKHLFAADARASNNKEFLFPVGGLPIRTFSGPNSVSPTGILVTPEANV